MLSAIVQKVTGQTVLDYLRPRLFDPLGIKNPTWGTSPQGVSLGGYGLSIRTEDIAKFGQLYLQKGKWNGKQLVPESWVEAATARQTSNGSAPDSDWDQGYGYQFWRSRHNAFRGDGAFGQYCIVMPEQDTVVAINSGVKDMQALINIVWDNLLPALQPSPLAANPPAEAAAQGQARRLETAHRRRRGVDRDVEQVAGKRFAFASNPLKLESVTPRRQHPTPPTWRSRSPGPQPTSPRRLATGRAALGPLDAQPVAASGAWTGDDTFTASVAFVETPFLATLRFKFAVTRSRWTPSRTSASAPPSNPAWSARPNDPRRPPPSRRSPAREPRRAVGSASTRVRAGGRPATSRPYFGSRTNATSSTFPSGSLTSRLARLEPVGRGDHVELVDPAGVASSGTARHPAALRG